MNHNYTNEEIVFGCVTGVKHLEISLDALKVRFGKEMEDFGETMKPKSFFSIFSKDEDDVDEMSDDAYKLYGSMLTLADSIDMMNLLKENVEKSKRDTFPLVDKELFIVRSILQDVDPSEFENIETDS